MFFDTHTHLNDEKLYTQVEAVISRAKSAGLCGVTDIGYDRPSSLRSLDLAQKYPDFIHAVLGYHPYDADKLDNTACDELLKLGVRKEVVAIGEIGLDYYRDTTSKNIQKDALITQIAIAKQLKKPIVIHDRDAHGDIMQILKTEKAGLYGGIIHCFSGSREMAKICLDLGFDIAFGGALTFANAQTLPEVCRYVPLSNILLETDCPYLSPHPFRGQTNEPMRVAVIAEKIALLKEMTIEEIGIITTQNAKRVYNIK